MEPIGEGHAPQLHGLAEDTGPDLAPGGGSFSWPAMVYSGIADAVQIRLVWWEGDAEHSASQTVSLN